MIINRKNFLFMCKLTNCNYPKDLPIYNAVILASGNIYATNSHLQGRLKNEYDINDEIEPKLRTKNVILVTKELIAFLKNKTAQNVHLDNNLVLNCEGEQYKLLTVEMDDRIIESMDEYSDSETDDERILNVRLNIKYLNRFLYGKCQSLSMRGVAGYSEMVKIKNDNPDFDGCIMTIRE